MMIELGWREIRRARLSRTAVRITTVRLMLLAVAAISACSAARPAKPNIEHMLATAKTASDHEAIAKYYEQEAADAEARH